MRVADLAVGRVGLDHQPVERDLLEDFQVLCGFEAAAVDADVEVQLHDLLDFLGAAGEGMHDAGGEAGSVLLDDVVEVAAGVAVVEVHGQFQPFCEIEVRREGGQLVLLAGVVQPVVIQPALPDRHQLLLHPLGLFLHQREVVLHRGVALLVEGLGGAARVHADGAVGVGEPFA